jgi:hypothetical protein
MAAKGFLRGRRRFYKVIRWLAMVSQYDIWPIVAFVAF